MADTVNKQYKITPIDVEDVLQMYEAKKSIRATAAALGMSHSVVRKALISIGIPCTPRAKEIFNLAESGKKISEIAEKMEISEKAVRQYLPYTRGSYRLAKPTENALRIRRCRIKKQSSRKHGDEI